MATIDHQVTYGGTQAQKEQLRERLGKPTLSRELISAYFDTPDLVLYQSGAQLRERRTKGSKTVTLEAKVPGHHGLQRFDKHESHTAIRELTGGRELAEVATQTKVRDLFFMSNSRLGRLAPDIVVALDEASVTTPSGQESRTEIELQLFTKFPWTRTVDPARLERFSATCRTYEATYGLERSAESGYQAIAEELLR